MTANKIDPGACAVVAVESRPTAVVKIQAPMNALPQAHRSSRAKLAAVLPGLDAGVVGRSLALWSPPSDGVMPMQIGVLIERGFAATGDVESSQTPAGRAARLLLVGPFDTIPQGWETLFSWCAAEGLALARINWEIYGPWSDDQSLQETELFALLA